LKKRKLKRESKWLIYASNSLKRKNKNVNLESYSREKMREKPVKPLSFFVKDKKKNKDNAKSNKRSN
jgi:hypothetical protein